MQDINFDTLFGYDPSQHEDDPVIQKYAYRLHKDFVASQPKQGTFRARIIKTVCRRYEKTAIEFLRERQPEDLVRRISSMSDAEVKDLVESESLWTEHFREVNDPAIGAMIELLLRCGQLRHYLRNNECEAAATITILMSRAVNSFQSISRGGAVRRGKRVRGGAKEGGLSSESYGAKRHKIHAKWQAAAEEIWRRHPEYSASTVARIIVRDKEDAAETVRKRITKPQQD